jgi:rod shape-determining protein MreD
MNRPHYILLPVSPLFIAFSLICAFMLNLLPWGRFIGAPDFVALVLVFWGIHQPRKVGIGIAFFMGLLMDVHDATLLGENALAYTLLSYLAIMIHRRVLWFPLLTQAMHVFPLLLMTQSIQVIVRFIVTGASRAGCTSSKA